MNTAEGPANAPMHANEPLKPVAADNALAALQGELRTLDKIDANIGELYNDRQNVQQNIMQLRAELIDQCNYAEERGNSGIPDPTQNIPSSARY